MEVGPRATVVFDMDGVLVDVTDSYREAIRETVRHFTGVAIENDLIQQYKNAGGWNNDWQLSQKIALDVSGREVPYQEIVRVFQELFLGTAETEGLILRERWLPTNGLLTGLRREHRIAIFTGRPRAEAVASLMRFVPTIEWDAIVADEDVVEHKPAPDGLLRIRELFPGTALWYVGDTVDDARAAAGAQAHFIGVVHATNPRREEVARLLAAEGAVAVLENVNEVEGVLANR